MGVGGQRLAKIDDRWERIDVDEHRLCGVGGLLVGLGDDSDDRLTDPADLVATTGEEGACHCRVVVRWGGLETEGLGGVDRDHSGHALGLGDVDVGDDAVGHL